MKIYQLVSNLAYGDGVGNDILAIDRLLKEKGYQTCVYAVVIDRRIPEGVARPYHELPDLEEQDIVILHVAGSSDLNRWIGGYRCHKIICYHNITPAAYFEPYSKESTTVCKRGIEEIRALCRTPELCIADSRFNREDLIRYGYRMPIAVIPILIPFEDYGRKPDKTVMERYDDGLTNILFTGRIVPNKKQEDVILAFYYYQKYYDPDSRLFLVGSYKGMESYQKRLEEYAIRLGVKNVIFTGHISFSSILSYYHLADVFLCMSEHEGFCIPLAEAMYFQIPVIACDHAAIGDTLGEGGILLREKDALLAAGCVHEVVANERLKEQILRKQKERLRDFAPDVVGEKWIDTLERFIQEKVKG